MALTNKDKKGLALLVVASLGALALLIAGQIAKSRTSHAGPDGCVYPVTTNTVIVLDHSEAMTEQTLKELAARALARVTDKAQVNERVTVFDVSEVSKKSLTPAFSRCKPQTEGNRLYEDTRGLERKYKKGFLEPLEAALTARPGNGKESPLAQALIDISLTQYLRGERNTLLVYSDMLEHTPKFSMYSYPCRDQSSTVKAFRASRTGAQERPAFKNTSTFLNIVPRTEVVRSAHACRDQLWPWFFGDSTGPGAALHIDFLPGA
jgi:hypothetical protein